MTTATRTDELTITRANTVDDLPEWLSKDELAQFLHESLKPYHDPLNQVHRGLDYALSDEPGKGGFVLVGAQGDEICGAVVILDTGMGGYIPQNLLLFIAVDPDCRGMGLGTKLMRRTIEECEGPIKLHVEHDNPAKRLYERMGFTSKYAEMRYQS